MAVCIPASSADTDTFRCFDLIEKKRRMAALASFVVTVAAAAGVMALPSLSTPSPSMSQDIEVSPSQLLKVDSISPHFFLSDRTIKN